jgi:hypothetical protein
MMFESYAIMATCVLINLHLITWGSYGEIAMSVICYSSLGVLVLFPIVLIIYSRHDWEGGVHHEKKERIEPFFEELDMRKGPIVIVHPIYFLLRRFLMAALVVYFRDSLISQVFFKAMSIIVAVNLIGNVQALHTPERRNLEYLNEIIIMLVLYTIICFSQFVPDPEARYMMGFVCIVIVASHLLINLWLISFKSFKILKFEIQIWFARI